jgi:phosphoglycolate phosphatase
MRGLIAFDLDGVLYSAEPFLGEAYRECIANINAQRPGAFPRVPSTREILDHVGWPVAIILQRLFPTIDPGAVDLLYAETLHVVGAHVARREGLLFPGVEETLARLGESGLTLVIASNGRRQYVETVLAAHQLTHYFGELVTVESDTVRDKAGILRVHLARRGVSSGEMIMVGDRSSDVEAAAAVGCAFIGCDYGHGHRAEIAAAGPVVSAFVELPAVINEILSAPRPRR